MEPFLYFLRFSSVNFEVQNQDIITQWFPTCQLCMKVNTGLWWAIWNLQQFLVYLCLNLDNFNQLHYDYIYYYYLLWLILVMLHKAEYFLYNIYGQKCQMKSLTMKSPKDWSLDTSVQDSTDNVTHCCCI